MNRSVVSTVEGTGPFKVVTIIRLECGSTFKRPHWSGPKKYEMANLLAQCLNMFPSWEVDNILMCTKQRKWQKALSELLASGKIS